MTTLVVDASVAAKWFLSEPEESLTDQARLLLRLQTRGLLQLMVPDLFWAEFGNLVWKAVKRLRATPEVAASAVDKVRQLGLAVFPSIELLPAALVIAMAYDRSFYDALYVALAESSEVELVTADEKLVRALGSRFPVRWLGAWKSFV